jgi:hypothetical protein
LTHRTSVGSKHPYFFVRLRWVSPGSTGLAVDTSATACHHCLASKWTPSGAQKFRGLHRFVPPSPGESTRETLVENHPVWRPQSKFVTIYLSLFLPKNGATDGGNVPLHGELGDEYHWHHDSDPTSCDRTDMSLASFRRTKRNSSYFCWGPQSQPYPQRLSPPLLLGHCL